MRILRALARRRCIVGVAFAVLLLCGRPAFASGVAIHFQAPEGCGSQRDFEAGVARIAGKPVSELDSAWASADVLIAPDANAFRLRVRVSSESGSPRERDLTVASCHEALQAAELIVATNLSAPPSELETEPATNAEQPPPHPHRPRVTIEDRPTKPGPKPSAAHGGAPLSALLGARIGLEPWLMPAPVAVAWGMLGLESERLRLELTFGATSHEAHAVPGGGAVTSGWLAAGLLGCYRGPGRAFELWGCVGAEGGRLRAAGQGGANLLNPRVNDSLWSAALVQAQLVLPITRGLSLAFGAQGAAALRAVHVTQFDPQSGETNTLYATPWLDVRPWLGLEGRFR